MHLAKAHTNPIGRNAAHGIPSHSLLTRYATPRPHDGVGYCSIHSGGAQAMEQEPGHGQQRH